MLALYNLSSHRRGDVKVEPDTSMMRDGLGLVEIDLNFPLNGKTSIICFENDHLTNTLKQGAFYETFLIGVLNTIFNDKDQFCFYDVGANVGYHSLFVKKKFKNAKVYSFEPLPNIFSVLEKNIENNFLDITPVNVALGEISGNINIVFDKSDSGNSKISRTGNVCKITSIDIISKELLVPDFIKIDVQGFEKFVLAGAKNVISNKRPYLIFEYCPFLEAEGSPTMNTILTALEKIGYEFFIFRHHAGLAMEKVNADILIEVNQFWKKEKWTGYFDIFAAPRRHIPSN